LPSGSWYFCLSFIIYSHHDKPVSLQAQRNRATQLQTWIPNLWTQISLSLSLYKLIISVLS
jgi:hypothetical protein